MDFETLKLNFNCTEKVSLCDLHIYVKGSGSWKTISSRGSTKNVWIPRSTWDVQKLISFARPQILAFNITCSCCCRLGKEKDKQKSASPLLPSVIIWKAIAPSLLGLKNSFIWKIKFSHGQRSVTPSANGAYEWPDFNFCLHLITKWECIQRQGQQLQQSPRKQISILKFLLPIVLAPRRSRTKGPEEGAGNRKYDVGCRESEARSHGDSDSPAGWVQLRDN